MITATGLELRAGARILIESASFRIAKGDRIGLVGRNGAGKTTLTKVLAGEGIPASGTVTRTGEVGYLPQDPRTGDLEVMPATASSRRAAWTPCCAACARTRSGCPPARAPPASAP